MEEPTPVCSEEAILELKKREIADARESVSFEIANWVISLVILAAIVELVTIVICYKLWHT